MTPDRLTALAERGISLDTETWAIRSDLPIPPVVCGSVGWLAADRSTVDGKLLSKTEALGMFCSALDDPGQVIAGANIAFDLRGLAAALARLGVDAMPAIFRALEHGNVYDLQIAEALHAIANGTLGKDPRTGQPLTNPETGKRGRYSLAICVDLVLGRRDAKANDEYRLRYHELDGVPIELWPQPARDYPVDDARNTHETAMAQLGILPRVEPRHEFPHILPGEPLIADALACVHCGSHDASQPCRVRRPNRNLLAVAHETYAAFALSLGAARGFMVDQSRVDVIERHARRDRERGLGPQKEAGFVRADDTEDRAAIKRTVAEAYGASEPCPVCRGTGHVDSSKVKTLQCPDCRGRSVPFKKGGAICAPTVPVCTRCGNTGRVKHPEQDQVACFEYERDSDGSLSIGEDGETVKKKTCDGTGLVLTDDVPRSDKDGISYGGSTLHESGDERLMAFGDYKENAKTLATYVPFLRSARVPSAIADDGSVAAWRDIALVLKPNSVPLETLRVSYSEVIQQLPRNPGSIDSESHEYVPSLRECLIARPGRVLSSEDYSNGESFAHAQSCIWTVGYSDLASALLAGVDMHSALGATVLGLSYEEFLRRKADGDKFVKNIRQASKPANFGFPGGMGAVKLVLQQRKQGEDTPCPDGPSWIDDGKGGKIRGYRGLRYCVLTNGAKQCGVRKTTLWGRRGSERKIPPTCVECIECAQRIRATWLKQWSENSKYFDYVSNALEYGHLIEQSALDRWPHARDWFRAGERLAPGEMMQHVSCVVRGGLEYSEACNGLFQQIIARAAKAALCRVARECYDSTYRVPTLTYENSKPSQFAGGPSPLYATSEPLAFMHDELVVEHAEQVGHEGATRVSEVMVEELAHICPDVAPAVQADPTIMREFSKSAEPRWRIGGKRAAGPSDRLVPWERKAA